jgi:dTMP kinase
MHHTTKGLLITFEGTEGSGKSTLIRAVASALSQLDQPTLQTREPGGSGVAEKIRSILLQMEMNPWTELLLYEASRAEHLAQTIRPALERGEIVLCDRYTDSTLAYQAHARGLPWPKVKALNQLATSGLKPHLTVLLDIDPEFGLKRAKDPNRFEAEGVNFQKRVRLGFLKARAEDSKRWLTLKVKKQTPEELAQSVVNHLRLKYGKRFLNSSRNVRSSA